MKIHTFTPSEAQSVGISSEQAADYRVYEAELRDGWGSPWGGFLIARAGWGGGGFLPGTVARTHGEAVLAWCADRQKRGAQRALKAV